MDFSQHIARALLILGEDWQYTPKTGGTARTVKAEFQNLPAEFLGVEGTNPRLCVKTSDVPGAKPGDTWSRNGVNYKSHAPKVDTETGLTEIQMERQ